MDGNPSYVTVEMLLSAVEAAEELLKEASVATDPRDRRIYLECARNTLDALPLVLESEPLATVERRIVGLALERLRSRIMAAENGQPEGGVAVRASASSGGGNERP